MKYVDLTQQQQNHLLFILEQYEPPEGTTHLDINDNTKGTFMRNVGDIEGDVWEFWNVYEDEWELADLSLCGSIYSLPDDVECKGEVEEEFEPQFSVSPLYELEDKIMIVWGILDDLKIIRDGADRLTKDEFTKLIDGVVGVGEIKMQNMFKTFEKCLRNR